MYNITKLTMIQKHYENFLTTLYRFIHDLDRYHQTSGTKQILEIYNKLDMAKVIFRVYTLLHKNSQFITNKDETLFQNEFELLPNLNLSEIWPTLVTGRKQKAWTYLSILQIESDILVNNSNDSQKQEVTTEIPKQKVTTETLKEVVTTETLKEVTTETLKEVTTETPKQEVTTETPKQEVVTEPLKEVATETQITKASKEPFVFDPYVGIGNVATDNDYGVEEMYASLANMPDEETSVGPGLESIANIIGLNKMIDFDGLSEQLRNMKSEDIDNATNNIKEMLGNGVDENTANMIGSMLMDISDEMKTKDLGIGSGFKNIMSIAESVAGKMKPKIQNGELDINNLMNSTQAFATSCKDENGNPMFDANSGPFAMLTQLMNNMTGQGQGQGQGMEDPEKMMEQCNSMLQGMGMDPAMLAQFAPPAKRTGGKKKKKKNNKNRK